MRYGPKRQSQRRRNHAAIEEAAKAHYNFKSFNGWDCTNAEHPVQFNGANCSIISVAAVLWS